jgi:hypothetical protein
LVDAPAAVAKHRAAFVILSTYAEADGRTHAVQTAAGMFGGLAVDIDTGNPALADVLEAVRAVIGNAAAFVYSSASAAPDRRKWRVLVPLAAPLPGADYRDTQLALFELLAERGLECDTALSRPGQPVYLPNVPPERRGTDGAPLFYQSHVVAGPPLELAGHAIAARRDAARAGRATAEAEAAARTAAYRSQRLAHAAATGDAFDAIEHFNAHHTVADMLARYGFVANPHRPTHYRHPESQNGSFATEDRGDHWVCVSTWAHTLNAGRTTKTAHRAGDAFDLFVAFEHGGNRSAAVRTYTAEVRPWRPAPVVEDLAPPVRVERLEQPPVVPVETIRETVEEQIRWACTTRPPLAVVRAGTAAAKTTTAVRVGAETPGRVVWNVQSHAAAAQVVAMHHAAGHMDCAAVPPRDETTCRCWTDADARQLAEEHGGRPGLSMERAMAVGMPMLACSQCPLSGMVKRRERVEPVADLEAWADPFGDGAADAMPGADSLCEYWQRTHHATAQRILVQCQQRTERDPAAIAPEGWETVTVFTDENALAVLRPRVLILPEELAAVGSVLRAAAANKRAAVVKMRFGEHRSREYELAVWADAVAGVAERMVAVCAGRAEDGGNIVEQLLLPALDPQVVPRAPHRKLLALIAREKLPADFTAAAFELVRMMATGENANATLRVAADAEGVHHASIHRSWPLEFDPRVTHIMLDATADADALQRIRPDALVLDPPGAAARVHRAVQWWQEINPRTAPAVVVDAIERVVEDGGLQRAALMLCKSHRDVLFPRTRPRNGKPEDKPANVKAIAAWNGKKASTAEAATAARLAEAEKLAARVARIRERLARDADGNVVVEHHRGSRSRGSNAFMAANGVDGVAVIGHTRTNPVDIVGYLLATGMVEAVAAGDGGWGDVAGELPRTDGTTQVVRWRGYACPYWAAAARAINRADLEQTAARGRPNLDSGVPVWVVAAEPCGLPLADPPARLPAGVAAVVDAMRRLAEAGPEVAQIATDATEPGVSGGGESCQRSIGHTPSVCLREGWHDSPGVPAAAIVAAVGHPERTTKRWLADAVGMGLVVATGAARATRYALPAQVAAAGPPRAPAPAMAADPPPPPTTAAPPPRPAVRPTLEPVDPPPPRVDATPCVGWGWEPAWDVPPPPPPWHAMPAELAAPPPPPVAARAGPCAV